MSRVSHVHSTKSCAAGQYVKTSTECRLKMVKLEPRGSPQGEKLLCSESPAAESSSPQDRRNSQPVVFLVVLSHPRCRITTSTPVFGFPQRYSPRRGSDGRSSSRKGTMCRAATIIR